MTTFRKRIYKHPGALFQNIGAIAYRAGAIPGMLKGTSLDPAFRERLMLVVTSVNACRYCTFVHSRMASVTGLSAQEIEALANHMFNDSPSGEVPALLYALHWAQNNGTASESMRKELQQTYGDKTFKSIELSLQMIRLGNLFGNTLDYSLYRISSGKWGADNHEQ